MKLLSLCCKLLNNLKLAMHNMPRDVATCWNSTYQMLCFALKYQEDVDKMTADRGAELRALEMDDEK